MQTKNIVIYTDIIAGFDTIRIYNMHLQSMHINENDMINSEDLETGFKYITDRLLSGFIQRADQIDILLDNILNCPHSVILCGDLNDLPYSYAYHRLKNKLLNAFAMAGRGFGFTFNGKLFFLRIDNQFYSNDLAIQSFKTHREIKNSDHFPISATYSVSK